MAIALSHLEKLHDMLNHSLEAHYMLNINNVFAVKPFAELCTVTHLTLKGLLKS